MNKTKYIFFTILTLLLLLLSCEKQELTNLVDPDNQLSPMLGGLSIIPLTDSSVTLNWHKNNDVKDKFVLERKMNSDGVYSTIAELDANETSFTDMELLTSNTYYYQLTGHSGENTTDTITDSISTSFSSIFYFASRQVNLHTAELSFFHNCNYESGYILERMEVTKSLDLVKQNETSEIIGNLTQQTMDSDLAKEEGIAGSNNVMNSSNIKSDYREFEIIAELPANTIQYLDETVLPNRFYSYRLKAFSNVNESNYIEETCDISFPAPTYLTISQDEVHTFTLNWDDNSQGEDGFKIERKIDAGTYSEIYTSGSNDITYTDDINTRSTFNIIHYRVRGYYEEDEYSDYSDNSQTISFEPVYGITYGYLLVNSIALYWEDDNEGEEGFYIQKQVDGGEWIETGIADTTYYVDETAEINSNLNYRVAPFSGNNIVDYIETGNIDNTFPAPANLTITQDDVHTFSIAWDDNSEGEDGYAIYHQIDEEGYSLINSCTENVTNYIDDINFREQLGSIHYKICAFSGQDSSAYLEGNNVISFSSPTNLTYNKLTISSIEINWEDNSVGEEGFKIDKKVGSANWQNEYTMLSEDIETWADENAEINEDIQYRVYGYSGVNESDKAITQVIDNTFPAPTNLQIHATSIISCTLEWDDNSEGEQGFKIDRKKDDEDWNEEYQIVEENVEFFTETDLEAGSIYYYRVYAYSGDNVTDPVETQVDLTFPAPTNLQVQATSFTSCQLSWDYSGLGHEDGFILERRLAGGNWSEIAQLGLLESSYEDLELIENETYEYMIYAYNSVLEQGNSAIVAFEMILVVIDFDGNVYEVVKIGEQYWMAENLKVTHYRNGDSIQPVTDNSIWSGLSTGAYGVYDNTPSNAEIYGNLYNGYAVDDSRELAPEGWHVPEDDEIKDLEMHLGMSQSEADALSWRGSNEGSKLAGREDLWNGGSLENDPDFASSGFNFLPGGYRYYNNGNYYYMGNNGYFWSSSAVSNIYAWRRKLSYSVTDVYRDYINKRDGYSVRCVRD